MTTEPEVRQYLRRLRLKRRLEGPRLDLRARVRAPTVLQKIFKQRNQKRSTYYVTSGRQIPEEADDQDDEKEKPFWVPPPERFAAFVAFQREKAKRHRQKELALPVHQKPNARTRLTAGLLRRLHIPETEPDTSATTPAATKTMVDMDPEFFTLVEGRPNRDRVSVREYIDSIRDLVRVRLKIGFNEDECILVDEQFRLERQRLDQILEQQKQYVDLFDQFLAEDHAASMELLKQADQAARLSAEKDAQIKVWIRSLGLIRTQVYQLEDKWIEARSLQKFLYLVSPMSWRREHDHLNGVVAAESPSEAGGVTDSAATASALAVTATDSTTASSVGALVRSAAKEGERRHSGVTQATQGTQMSLQLDRAASLQDIIDNFLEETRASHSPKLFFTEPEQLVKVFRSLAAQSLASLVHIEQLRLPLEALQAGVAQAKERVEQELQVLREQVADLEKDIAWEEQRVQQLHHQGNVILATVYQDMLVGSGSANVLALRVWVEDIYESCIAPNDSNLTAFQMMCAVERAVAAELLALDYLDQEHVKRARKHLYMEERTHMRDASDAQRKLQQLEQLVYRMERTLEPPPARGRHRLVFRSKPPEPKKPPPPPPEKLSEEEQDRRAFFTDSASDGADPLCSKLVSPVPKGMAVLTALTASPSASLAPPSERRTGQLAKYLEWPAARVR